MSRGNAFKILKIFDHDNFQLDKLCHGN